MRAFPPRAAGIILAAARISHALAKRFRKALREAKSVVERGGYWEEPAVLDRLEGADPAGPRDYADRGLCLAGARRYDAAVADFEAAVSGGVEDSEVYYVMAVSCAALGERGKALRALRRSVSISPGWDNAVYALCWELELAGRYGEALAELRRYKRLTGANLAWNRHIYQHWGRIRGRQGKWRLAYASFVRATWLRKPGNDEPEAVRQKYRMITDLRRKAKKRDPADPRSFWLLAAGLINAGWYELAVDVMYTAARMRPNPEAYQNVGHLYRKGWRSADAIDAYLDGIGTLSGSVPPSELATLYEHLVITLIHSGRMREALKYCEEAASLGISGSKIRSFPKFARENPDEIAGSDPVSMGHTAPHYESYITESRKAELLAGH